MENNMVFKDVKLKLKTEKIGKCWIVMIDGVGFSSSEIGKKYNINRNTVSHHLSLKTSEEFRLWLQHRIELESLGLGGSTVALFKRDGAVCWAQCIMEATGCCSSQANYMLHAWRDKEIDCDVLFNPTRKAKYKPRKTTGAGNPNWQGLSNKSRDHKLSDLKVGTWEKQQKEPDGFYTVRRGRESAQSGRMFYFNGD